MNIVLFASGEVGFEIVSHFAKEGVAPKLVVLAQSDTEWSKRIADATNAGQTVTWGRHPTELQKETLRSLDSTLGILAWWPFLLKPDVFEIPKLGCLNFHPALLPCNRGKHPNFWSIVEGKPFGVTLHFVDQGIDTGDIAFQEEIPVSWVDTGGTLHARARAAIVDLFKRNFRRIISGDIPRSRQPGDSATFHRGSELENASRIDLDRECSPRDLLNILRAKTYPPYPAAWFEDNGEVYEVRIEITRRQSPPPSPDLKTLVTLDPGRRMAMSIEAGLAARI